MALAILLPLRILQALMALVVLGLSAYVAHWYNSETLTASPSQFNFLLFTSVWSLLSVIYLELSPRRWPRLSHPYAHLSLELTSTIFLFSGFIALAVFLSKLLFCRGSVCMAARADAVIAALDFVLWTVTTVMLAVELGRTGFRNVQAAHAMKSEMARTPV